ncbi:MAG: hypothetical protein LBN93_11255 [Candidatus Symbiothrix sp.]|jgi:hypothetical protein|nr:hypothetical protein [Candidatus Symbiothrix sp.]
MKTQLLKWLCSCLLFVGVVVTLASCGSSGAKSLQKGNYYEAVIESVKKLHASPNKQDVQNTLITAYPLAVEIAVREINNASAGNNANKYDVMVTQYERLNRMADEIYHSPKALELIPYPSEYHAELSQAKAAAAGQNYALGIAALKQGTMEQARVAYQYFLNTDKYVPGYEDVLNKIDESLYAATLRVIVEPPITPANYQLSADFFYNNLISEMSRRTQTKFVRLYTPEEAKKENMRNPHQYMMLDFATFTVGNVYETNNTTDMKSDSVVTGTVKVDGKTYNSYATVKARFTKHIREIVSSGTLNVSIKDATNNRIIEQRKFNGTYVWSSVWGSYTGDDRALNREQKDWNKRQPQLPPPNQDLFIEFTKPIYTQVTSYVRSFYSRW